MPLRGPGGSAKDTLRSRPAAAVIEAQAHAEAERIRGEGEAEALRIYARAYNQDPDFYEFFYRTLQAYRKAPRRTTQHWSSMPIPTFAKFLFDHR